MAAVGDLYNACGRGHVAVHFVVLHSRSHPLARSCCRRRNELIVSLSDVRICFDRRIHFHLIDIVLTQLTFQRRQRAKSLATRNDEY